MYEMTVRTPGLTWIRLAASETEAVAFLKAAGVPGCEIMVRDRHGATVDLGADLVAAADSDELPLAA